MKKYKLLVLLLTLFLILVCIGILLYPSYIIIDVRTLGMELKVEDAVGFKLDNDAIYFGATKPGGMSKRNINMSNDYDFPLSVSINIKGNISEFVSVSENHFVLMPAEQKIITYYAVTNKNTEKGVYTGITSIMFRRAFFT